MGSVVVFCVLGAGVVFGLAIGVVFILVLVVGNLLIAGPGWGRGSTPDGAPSKVGGVGGVWGGYGCWVAHLWRRARTEGEVSFCWCGVASVN